MRASSAGPVGCEGAQPAPCYGPRGAKSRHRSRASAGCRWPASRTISHWSSNRCSFESMLVGRTDSPSEPLLEAMRSLCRVCAGAECQVKFSSRSREQIRSAAREKYRSESCGSMDVQEYTSTTPGPPPARAGAGVASAADCMWRGAKRGWCLCMVDHKQRQLKNLEHPVLCMRSSTQLHSVTSVLVINHPSPNTQHYHHPRPPSPRPSTTSSPDNCHSSIQ